MSGILLIGNAWGLLGLAALPAILAIHLFRRRFAPKPVSALFLFGERRQTVVSGRNREPVRLQCSLWCELACALAMTWWLVDPHLSDREHARQLVVVLDSRARMLARPIAADPRPSAWEAVAHALDERLAELADGDRVTVIASGSPPRLLIGPGAAPADARKALAGFLPQGMYHELDESLALATELAGGSGQVLVASDRVPEHTPLGIGCIARGTALPTSGIAEARWLDDHEGLRVVARIYAHGSASRRTLEVRGAQGAVLARRELEPAPGRDAAAVIALPRASPEDQLTLALVGPDALPVDDVVSVIRPRRRVVRVASAAMIAPAVERVLAGIPDVEAVAEKAPSPHLRIVDRAAPDDAPAGIWQVAVAPGRGAPVLGPFLARRGHPLLAEVDFTGVLWAGGARASDLAVDTAVLLAAGDAVLVSERRRGRDRLIALHLDPSVSSLRNHPSWPSLIANLVSARRSALSGVAQPNVTAGRQSSAMLPAGVAAVTLVSPDGRDALLRADGDGQAVIPPLVQAGIHRLEIAGEPWERLNIQALDPRLGDLVDASSQSREPADPVDLAGSAERRRSPLALILPLVIAAAMGMFAWMAFKKEEG
ncbi:MAG: hypothetical protein H0V44_02585 [Planctomycetes bacterium]|nr:hypothetical protein [Planctomycetota bacterium]